MIWLIFTWGHWRYLKSRIYILFIFFFFFRLFWLFWTFFRGCVKTWAWTGFIFIWAFIFGFTDLFQFAYITWLSIRLIFCYRFLKVCKHYIIRIHQRTSKVFLNFLRDGLFYWFSQFSLYVIELLRRYFTFEFLAELFL